MTRDNQKNQAGFVAIIVTLIIMLVLSLIVVGFAKLTRREQRQSLDRQLASQAYYAAESGINDVRDYVQKQIALGSTVGSVADCTSLLPALRSLNASTSYPCALLDTSPDVLSYTNIALGSSRSFPVRAEGPAVLSSISIGWNNPNKGTYTSCTTSPSLPSLSGWGACPAGILRVDLVPMNALDRNSLVNKSLSFLLYPVSSGGISTITYATLEAAQRGSIQRVNCAAGTPADCNLEITNLANSTTAGYYMHVRPIYRSANLYVSGKVAGAPSSLTDAQATIDVTGKANDVLKRLRATVSLTGSDNSYDFAIESADSLCKLYIVTNTVDIDGAAGSDPSCSTAP